MYSRSAVEFLGQAGRVASVVLLLLALLVACVPGQFVSKKAQCTHPGLQSIDVPSDDSALLFSYCDEDTSYIATSGIDGGAVTVVRRAEDKAIIQRVVFSPDDKKVIFIERSSRDKSYVYSMDPDGSNLQPLTYGSPGTNNVLDIVISADGQRLYFINAAIFRSYSPIAAARPHDVDFYSMKWDGSDLRKITGIHAYSLSGLALSGDESELFYFGGVVDIDSGAYLGPLPFEPSPTAGIEGKIAVWTSPHPLSEVSKEGLLVLASGKLDEPVKQPPTEVAGYGLYLHDIHSRLIIREIVWLPAYLDSPTWLHHDEVILFLRNDLLRGANNRNYLWRIRADGSDLKHIRLDVPQS